MTVQALRSRRPETLAELLQTHGREIQAVAWLILRDRGLAEDVTIETLLTAFEKAGSIRDDAALRAWLLRVATNKALSAGAPRGGSSTSRSCRTGARPVTSRPRRRIVSRLLAGVAELPLQMRAAVVLRYYGDLPVEAVAAALGKSPNTIKAQLQNGARSAAPVAHGTDRARGHGGPPCMTRCSNAASAKRLRTEGDEMALTITAAELERRLAIRRRARTSRGAGLLLAAAVGVGLVGASVRRVAGSTLGRGRSHRYLTRRSLPSRARSRAADPRRRRRAARRG